jgi:hypothetical protein
VSTSVEALYAQVVKPLPAADRLRLATLILNGIPPRAVVDPPLDLKEQVAQIIHEELGNCVGGIRFTGPYEGEEFNVFITLQDEPEDFDNREDRLYDRVWQLGYDIGIFVDFPEETIAV